MKVIGVTSDGRRLIKPKQGSCEANRRVCEVFVAWVPVDVCRAYRVLDALHAYRCCAAGGNTRRKRSSVWNWAEDGVWGGDKTQLAVTLSFSGLARNYWDVYLCRDKCVAGRYRYSFICKSWSLGPTKMLQQWRA